MSRLIYKQESYDIIGACITVHNELGCGFLEAVYQESLALIFNESGIPYSKEKQLNILFRGQILNKKYYADFICYDKVIIEVKALSKLTGEHEAQILNYLKATNLKLGILVNFGTKSLEYKRFVL